MKNLTDKDIAQYFGTELDEVTKDLNNDKKKGLFNTLGDYFNKENKNQIISSIKSVFKAIKDLSKKEVNILIVGASGSGKSETINALLKDANIHNQKAIARKGSDSVTMDIISYKIGNCTIYDTPGLGDILEKEIEHIKKIKNKLKEKDEQNQQIIDLVIVILNASNLRNLKSEYELINDIILPNLKNKQKLIIAINKTDTFDDGDFWDKKKNKPTQQLRNDIELEIKKIRVKIKASTGVDVEPIYYSAGRKERNKKPWNLIKLYEEMNKYVSNEKKIVLCNQINENKENFINSDNFDKTNENIKKDIKSNVENIIKNKVEEKEVFYPKKKKEKKRKKTNISIPETKIEPEGWLSKIIGAGLSIAAAVFSW